MAAERVLVVEDDAVAREVLVTALESDGYDVVSVADGHVALERARSFLPQLALLDQGLPGLDGRTVARRLRGFLAEVAIIFVTAADAAEERRAGFRAGGDDYIVKPFDAEELLLRVAAVLRRSEPSEVWQAGDLVVDSGTHRVRRADHAVDLTATEFALLEALVRNGGRVVSKQALLETVWGYDSNPHVLEVHISLLRSKLEAHGPRLIETVRGVGYRYGG